MREPQVVRWILKPAVWAGCVAPAVWLIAGVVRADLGADPVKTLTHTTGLSALTILLVTLAVSPVRWVTGINGLVRLRRPLGLFSFFYAVVHFLIYAVFDHQLSVADITADVVEHPWVLAGFAALVILALLAATSPAAAVRRLGGKRWQRLHRLVYLAGGLAVLHFFWLVKKDVSEPLRYAAILALLLGVRILRHRGNRPAAVAEPIQRT